MKTIKKLIKQTSLVSKLVATGMLILVFGSLQAQRNLSVTFRSGMNIPTGDLGTTTLTNGTNFEITASYLFVPHLAAYGGWGWNSFSDKATSGDAKILFAETGYTMGLQWFHSLQKESKLNLMLAGGAVYNQIETENNNGDLLNDSGFDWGWQVEGGLIIPVGERWQLIPTARYHTVSRTFDKDGAKTSSNLEYFSLGLGVSWSLWSLK